MALKSEVMCHDSHGEKLRQDHKIPHWHWFYSKEHIIFHLWNLQSFSCKYEPFLWEDTFGT